jgi:hypothetical protein
MTVDCDGRYERKLTTNEMVSVFTTVNFPFKCSNITASPAYIVGTLKKTIENKQKYHTVGTLKKNYRKQTKIAERGKIDTPNTPIHDPTVNFPFKCSNITASPAYIFQLIRLQSS